MTLRTFVVAVFTASVMRELRRRFAVLVAMLGLLFQPGMPSLPEGGVGMLLGAAGSAAHANADVAGSHVHSGAHAVDDEGSGGEKHAGHGGPCHFCRVLGAAVPPPPAVELFRVEPSRIDWPADAPAVSHPVSLSRANPVRAPPRLLDRRRKSDIV